MIPTFCLLLSLFDLEGLTAVCVTPEPYLYCSAGRVWAYDPYWGHAPTLKFCRPETDRIGDEVDALTARMGEYIDVSR